MVLVGNLKSQRERRQVVVPGGKSWAFVVVVVVVVLEIEYINTCFLLSHLARTALLFFFFLFWVKVLSNAYVTWTFFLLVFSCFPILPMIVVSNKT
ncbi:hypothetical protein V8F06_006728 [Rhypophila decipiens]